MPELGLLAPGAGVGAESSERRETSEGVDLVANDAAETEEDDLSSETEVERNHLIWCRHSLQLTTLMANNVLSKLLNCMFHMKKTLDGP